MSEYPREAEAGDTTVSINDLGNDLFIVFVTDRESQVRKADFVVRTESAAVKLFDLFLSEGYGKSFESARA